MSLQVVEQHHGMCYANCEVVFVFLVDLFTCRIFVNWDLCYPCFLGFIKLSLRVKTYIKNFYITFA